jgi:hypothetical protein
MNSINIVSLIEKNASTRLTSSYQSTLLNKIQNSFAPEEQQLFVASFYCYLNYDSKKDFVIDFTNVWKWCGFSRKDHAKKVLEKHFVEGVDYKVENDAPPIGGAKIDSENKTDNFAPAIGGAKSIDEDKGYTKYDPRGGYNKEKITLTVNTFKKFCMKAGTKKADEVHDYYIKLEELLQETLQEQSDELQKQLGQKEVETKEKQKLLDEKEELLRTEKKSNNKLKSILSYSQGRYSHYHKFDEKPCVYIVQNPNDIYGARCKIGKTDNMNERLSAYRTSMPSVKVRLIFYTEYSDLFEKVVKRKYADHLEFNSHEWVFFDLGKLIQSFYDLDRMCNFNSLEEKELWRYNLEDPPKDPNVIEIQQSSREALPKYIQDKQKRTRSKTAEETLEYSSSQPSIVVVPNTSEYAENIPRHNMTKYQEFMVGILPGYKIFSDYTKLNKEAPFGLRYCNGYCQKYISKSEFKKIGPSWSQHCYHCENLMNFAEHKIATGELAAKDIRNNPDLLRLKQGERYCHMCDQCLPAEEFSENDKSKVGKISVRKECKKCHNKQARTRYDLFDEKIEEEANFLKSLTNAEEVNERLNSYTKTDLHKFMTYLGVGRKYNDNKKSCVIKIQNFLLPQTNAQSQN